MELQSLQEILIVFLKLLMAHMVSDFLVQPESWIEQRKIQNYKSGYLYVHILIVILLSWFFLGDWTKWKIPVFIGLTHLLIDIWKSYRPDTFISFLADQFAHIMVLVLAAIIYSGSMQLKSMISLEINPYFLWVTVSAFFIVMWPSGYFVSAAMSRWQEELSARLQEDRNRGLDAAGMWIGILERILILLFILMDQFGAVGFLIAAKSVFRFGSISNANDQILAEYILIGTLVSFSLAISVGVVTRFMLNWVV
ncbi:MAG: DUF3307 domain-containing protein [Balneolaceae bacterium]